MASGHTCTTVITAATRSSIDAPNDATIVWTEEGKQGLPLESLITVAASQALWVQANQIYSSKAVNQDIGAIAQVSSLQWAPYLGSHTRAENAWGDLPRELGFTLCLTDQSKRTTRLSMFAE